MNGKTIIWLETDTSKSKMKCKICTEMKLSLKSASVWINEQTPNSQVSAIPDITKVQNTKWHIQHM